MSTQAQSSLAVQTRPLVDGSDLFVQILASLALSPEKAVSPVQRWTKMRRMGLTPGDALDEQFMSRSADRTARELAHHQMAKRYAQEEEALGFDRNKSYRAARVVMTKWRATPLPRTSQAGLGGGGTDLGTGGSDHGCRDRCSGDNDDADPDWDATSSEICGCLARSRGMPFFMALDGLWPGVPFGYFEICTGLDGDILGCCVDVTDRVATLFDVQQPRTIGGHYVAV